MIFHDNDFEVFLNPTGDTRNYFEFEINALNTGWDLFLPKPYREGGKADNSWEIPGLRTAVAIQGTLNDAERPRPRLDGRDRVSVDGVPRAQRARSPPDRRRAWRINFSRVEWQIDDRTATYRKVPGKPEDNWVWSPPRGDQHARAGALGRGEVHPLNTAAPRPAYAISSQRPTAATGPDRAVVERIAVQELDDGLPTRGETT